MTEEEEEEEAVAKVEGGLKVAAGGAGGCMITGAERGTGITGTGTGTVLAVAVVVVVLVVTEEGVGRGGEGVGGTLETPTVGAVAPLPELELGALLLPLLPEWSGVGKEETRPLLLEEEEEEEAEGMGREVASGLETARVICGCCELVCTERAGVGAIVPPMGGGEM